MKQAHRHAYNALKKLGVPVFERADHKERGNFGISAEHAASREFVDYYSMNPNWMFGVNPVVEAVLRKHRLMAEWANPGELTVYDN